MNVYIYTFKFREPFQTIIDSDIILHCENASFDLIKGIKRTIQADIKPMITQCCIQALYKTENQAAIDIAKSFERRRCNHPPSSPLTPKECIKSIILPNNKHRYILASQIFELRKELMNVPGVPMIFMNRSVMVMEPMLKKTLSYSKDFETKKLTAGLNAAPQDNQADHKSVKRKGVSQPNPLSNKKKKSESLPKIVKEDLTPRHNEKPTRRKRKHSRKSGSELNNESNQD